MSLKPFKYDWSLSNTENDFLRLSEMTTIFDFFIGLIIISVGLLILSIKKLLKLLSKFSFQLRKRFSP